MNAGGKVSKAVLLTEFRCLELDDVLIVHIAEQNAGLLIRRSAVPSHSFLTLLPFFFPFTLHGQSVTFEAFEASPVSEQVLASENALEWDFPGSAIAMPFTEFISNPFQEHLATFLEQASTESIQRFAARTDKAGSSVWRFVTPSIPPSSPKC